MKTAIIPNNGVWTKLGRVSKIEAPVVSSTLQVDIDPAGLGWARNSGLAPVEVRFG